MDEPTQVTHIDEDSLVETNGHKDGSFLSELRARRAELAGERTLEIEVPGYRSKLALQLGPIDGKTQTTLLERQAKSKAPDRDFNLNADYLAAALVQIVGRREFGEEWLPLAELAELDVDTIRLDTRLVELLQLTPAQLTAREVLRSLFALAPSPEVAITLAGGEYISWAGAVNQEVDEQFQGE